MKNVIGSIVENGRVRPFIFNPQTGELRLDENSHERNAPLDSAEADELRGRIRGQLAAAPDEIRIGEYYCTVCRKWFEAAGELWSYGICLSCSLDRATEISEWYEKEDRDD
ncbi:MAG: hypothetical protein JSS81_19460 [Acidobacteria bacterium]|nr:hypothetical protein [Acidobacteriota bacterium]